MTFCYTYRSVSLTQPASEKSPPAKGRNKCRDPKLGNISRVRNLGRFSPKCDVFINPSLIPQSSGNYMEEEVEKI